MHDYFDILGVSRNARAQDIRRACLRRVRQVHPDIGGDEWSPESPDRARCSARARTTGAALAELPDIAIDFVDIGPLVDRMRTAFFATER